MNGTPKAVLSALVLLTLSGAAPPASIDQDLSLNIAGLRSTKGILRICLTRLPDYFPDCTNDPEKRHFSVAANRQGSIDLGQLPPGGYAIAIIHDENGNNRLDTFAGIPREGFGFSENPPIRFGPPSFRSARFLINNAPVQQTVRMKYML